MRTFIAVLIAGVLTLAAGCSGHDEPASPYGAQAARIGESQAVLGWNISVSNLRWDDAGMLVDVDAAPVDPAAPHAKPTDLRFGVYGALSHPLEVTGVGSCANVAGPNASAARPLSAGTEDRLSGTVCLGSLKERSQVRGVYMYSPADRIPGSTVAYAASFPVGMAPTDADTGLTVTTAGVTAWRADGTPLTPESLGDPAAFSGDGYMLLNLIADAPAARYRADAADRGGPMMLLVAPTQPVPNLDPACRNAGSTALILPEASLDAVHVATSLCSHGEVTAAVLYASVSIVGTHAAVWASGG